MKKKINKNGNVETVELMSSGKRLTMTRDEEGLSLDLSMVESSDNNLYQENFIIPKKDKMFKAFDGVFKLYPLNQELKGLFFDTTGASLLLSKYEDGYMLLFMKEFDQGGKDLKAKLVEGSTENKSMNKLFDVLAKKRKLMNYALPLNKAQFSRRIKSRFHHSRFQRDRGLVTVQ